MSVSNIDCMHYFFYNVICVNNDMYVDVCVYNINII